MFDIIKVMGSYKDVNTGRVGDYPDHFAALFPSMVPFDGDVPCPDCFIDDADRVVNEGVKAGKHRKDKNG